MLSVKEKGLLLNIVKHCEKIKEKTAVVSAVIFYIALTFLFLYVVNLIIIPLVSTGSDS